MASYRAAGSSSEALGCVAAGLAPAVLLAPIALRLATGGTGSPDPALAVLLLETLFVMGAFGCLGLLRGGRPVWAALTVSIALPIAAQIIAVLAGAPPLSLLVAQPAVLSTALLAWGIGRAARDGCRRNGAATAVTFSLLAASVAGLLALSHVAPALAERPQLAALLISLDPIVAVTSAAGFDLVRSPALYDVLSLSGYRFHYADPVWPPVLLGTLGLILGCARLRLPRERTRNHRLHLNPSGEELTT